MKLKKQQLYAVPNGQIGEVAEVIAGQSPEGKYYNADGRGYRFIKGKQNLKIYISGSRLNGQRVLQNSYQRRYSYVC
jgi:hypothetical protein